MLLFCMEKIITACDHCGNVVARDRTTYYHTVHTYCSPDCTKAARHMGRMVPCSICDTLVYRSGFALSRWRRTFCYQPCRPLRRNDVLFAGKWRYGCA